jgi:hypothetical protein
MLFDLRGRGRRRTVQVLYLGLALLMGGGLVFLGVGGGFGSGGILNAFTGNEGSSSAIFSNQIKKYEKLTKGQPNSVYAWEQLTLAQLHEAGSEAYVTRTGGLTSKGKELFSQVAQSWNSYLALNPPKPSLELAKEMVRVFDEEGLNNPASAVQVLQIVVAAEPTSESYYASLAEYAYKAHNTRIGDLASAKAVGLAPAAQRKRLKTALAAIKKNPTGAEGGAQSGSGAAGASGAVSTSSAAGGSNGTVTIGGKTYPIHGGASSTTGTSTPTKK